MFAYSFGALLFGAIPRFWEIAKAGKWETTSCDFGPMRVCWKNLHTAIGCNILDIVCTSKWENVSLNYFEIDSLALQKGRSTNQHPYTKPSKCEQWREERCGQTLQGMWMSMKPRTMLQDQMWMNMEQAKINDYAARYQKWNTQHCSLHIQLYDHNPQPCTCDWR